MALSASENTAPLDAIDAPLFPGLRETARILAAKTREKIGGLFKKIGSAMSAVVDSVRSSAKILTLAGGAALAVAACSSPPPGNADPDAGDRIVDLGVPSASDGSSDAPMPPLLDLAMPDLAVPIDLREEDSAEPDASMPDLASATPDSSSPDIAASFDIAHQDGVSADADKADMAMTCGTDYPAGSYPNSVAIGDLNGDGRLDLATVNVNDGTVSIFLNQGNGTFALRVDYLTGKWPFSVASGDLNGDGKLDLATANGNDDSVSVLLNQGNGTFAPKVDYPTGRRPSVDVGDFNGDGKPDIATANSWDHTVSILLNQGNGTFAQKVDYPTGKGPFLGAIADLNGDGKLDLATANYEFIKGNTASVLLNQGNGIFAPKTDYLTGKAPFSIAAQDLNGDGKPDLVTANYEDDSVSVLLNQGNGIFAPKVDYPTQGGPPSVALGDLNGDGKLDIATANLEFGLGNTVSMLLNRGNGTFDPKTDYPVGDSPRFVALGDLDGDNKLDLAVAKTGGTVRVLLNRCLQGP